MGAVIEWLQVHVGEGEGDPVPRTGRVYDPRTVRVGLVSIRPAGGRDGAVLLNVHVAAAAWTKDEYIHRMYRMLLYHHL